MMIKIKKNADTALIEITGRLDTTTAPALEKAINEDVVMAKELVLDAKGLEYVSSAGLRVLLSTHKKMKQTGTFKVINVCQDVMEIFEMTGFASVLEIE